MLDSEKDDNYPPRHNKYWSTSDHYLMGNVTPGDMRAIIQSQEQGSPGGGQACIDLLNRMWDCRTKRRVTSKQVRPARPSPLCARALSLVRSAAEAACSATG